MRKKIAALFMAIVMTASLGVNAMAAYNASLTPVPLRAANAVKTQTFNDVPLTHWAFDYIDKVSYAGMINGLTPTWYGPSDNMTRAQFVTVLSRMEGQGALEGVTTQTAFSDVDPANRFAGPIKWATDKGIVQGYSDGTFRPTQAISRAQFAAMIHRYIVYKNYDQTDARGNYLKNGYGKEKRLSLVTEMNATLRSALGFQEGDPVPAVFSDTNLVSEVFTGDVEYARVRGLIQGFSDGTLRPNIAINRGQIAAILGRFMSVLGGSDNTVAYTPFLDGEDPRNPINYVRRSGGGGGSSGYTPTPAPTNNFMVPGTGRYGIGLPFDSTASGYPYTVKFVAVDNEDNAIQNTVYANLYDTDSPASDEPALPLSSDMMANTRTASGFVLAIGTDSITGYTLNEMKVYPFEVSSDTVNSISSSDLQQPGDYTRQPLAVSMNANQFNTHKQVTVVAEFTKNTVPPEQSSDVVKTVPTTFYFVAADSSDRVMADAGTAAFYANASASASTTLNSGSSGVQGSSDGSLAGIKMAFQPAAGYELYKRGTDYQIKLYDISTSGDENNWSSGSEIPAANYGLNPENGSPTVSMTADQMILDEAAPNALTKVVVVVQFIKSQYEYAMTFKIDVGRIPFGTGYKPLRIDVGTTRSFSDGRYLTGSTPLREAGTLLFNDSNSSDVLKNNQAVNERNVEYFLNTLLFGASDIVLDLEDETTGEKGYKLNLKDFLSVEKLADIIEESGKDMLNEGLPSGDFNAEVLNSVRGMLDENIGGADGLYNKLFNAASDSARSAQAISSISTNFRDSTSAHNSVTADTWVTNTVSNENNLKLENNVSVTDGGLKADTANTAFRPNVLVSRSAVYGYEDNEVVFKTAFENLNITINSLKGDFAITIPLGDLNLEAQLVNNTTQYISVNEYIANEGDRVGAFEYKVAADGKSVELKGKLENINLGDGVTVNNVETRGTIPFPVDMVLNGAEGFNMSVASIFNGMTNDMKANVEKATSGAAQNAVLTSLQNNVLDNIKSSDFVVAGHDKNSIRIVKGISADSDEVYRSWLADFYEGFWDFHESLFAENAYGGTDSTSVKAREDVLNGVLEPILDIQFLGGRGKTKAASLAKYLAKDSIPTISSLYEYFGGDMTKAEDDLTKAPTVKLPNKVNNMLGGMGGIQIGTDGKLYPEFHILKRPISASNG